MPQFAMTIDGAPVGAAGTFYVVDPATGEPFAQVPDATRQQLDDAMASAARAFIDWRADERRRRDALQSISLKLRGAVDDVAPLLTREQGKPLREAVDEVKSAALWFRYFAHLDVPPDVIQDDGRPYVEVVRRPMGVVAAITPWNFPLVLAAWKLAPALRAGNTVVLKPSPYTPLSTLAIGALMNEVLPPGVLNVVTGGDDLGAWMTSHPVPRKISFTGSTATGKKVAVSAASDLKRLTLELGGNDAAIVLDDADPAIVAPKIFAGAFVNAGQLCTAIKRVYVPNRLYDDFVEALTAIAHSTTVGPGLDPASDLGPLNNRPQLERVEALVADAIAHGAVTAAGGQRCEGAGYFYEPTIVAGISNGVALVNEEQFGPALPVVAYNDVDEAVARANTTAFGLSGSVWSSDPERASSVAAELECGTAWVNTHAALAPHQPFGGLKWSGIGVENGPWGLHSFTELQVRHQAR